uniref:sulfatase n=1 Tax=Pararhizobium sp. IMCC3301 TaxID=3067904 RepID=UPI00274275FF|nr:sulfatase [Pararhizobium sp. IMCC3301]
MKTVFLLFDSVNRLMLEPYGGELLKTPNFKRLAERSVTFDNHYIGSMPCMPARRDMQSGRHTFLHRSWGPLEPFDNSFPELLKSSGSYSHLISDHYHYFEDGGATYHTRYNSFDFIRGQESDPWKVMLEAPIDRIREQYHPSQNDPASKQNPYHYMINREFIKEEADFPSVKCFAAGYEFLDKNRNADNWFLQIETFDPHEPFFAPARLKEKFQTDYEGPILDWPRYERVSEPQDEIDELRANYMALLTLCDELLGKFLDYFDEHDMWKDTALILTTDHGFLLGEHDWWAKNRMPMYEEISHIPLFVYHPDHKDKAGQRRKSLTQTIDLMPTICEIHGAEIPAEVAGQSLLRLLEKDESDREAAIFGYWGGGINVVDGRYTYFCYPKDMQNQELYQYTLMPTHMTKMFTVDELKSASLVGPFDFTKGVPLLRVAHRSKADTKTHSYHFPEKMLDTTTVLYDLETDPGQTTPIDDPQVTERLNAALFRLMAENDAPAETVQRMKDSLLD